MSLLSQRLKRLRGSVRVSVLVSLLVGVLVPAFLWAGAPAWWATRGVVTPGAASDDYAAVNQGQVKHIAKQGYEEMKATLPGGAGSALDAVWATPVASTDDYRAINLGQLKAVAEPFYARLQALGYTGQPLAVGKTRPWTGTGADDYALANIGQVKNLFSFDPRLLDLVAPTTPVGLASSILTPTGFTLNWSASTDNASVAGYDIYLDGVKVATSLTTSFTFTNLADATNYSMFIKARDAAGNVSGSSSTVQVVTGAYSVKDQVFVGEFHSLALKRDGTVWAWGINDYGQLGQGNVGGEVWSPAKINGLSGVKALSVGRVHSLALMADGTVYAWGYNYMGQLGDGTIIDKSTPQLVPGLTGVKSIAAGQYHSLAVKSDGTVVAWGANDYGQLGQGSTTPNKYTTPVQVINLSSGVSAVASGDLTSYALKDGSIWAWGYNSNGQFGNNTITPNSPTPVQATSFTGVATAIAAGSYHIVALKSDGTVWAWGRNSNGQIGVGASSGNYSLATKTSLPAGQYKSIAAGYLSSAAIKSDGALYTWGLNNSGQIGNGNTVNTVNLPYAVTSLSGVNSIAIGQTTYAVNSQGALYSWGNNQAGQLGRSTNVNQSTPGLVPAFTFASQLALPTLTPDSGGYLTAPTVQVATSDLAATLRYTLDGTEPTESSALIASGATLVPGQGLLKVKVFKSGRVASETKTAAYVIGEKVYVAESYTLALKADGSVWAWGKNDYGVLGQGNAGGEIWTPTKINSLSGVKALAVAQLHCLALKSDGTVWAWGYNGSGRLGNGGTNDALLPQQVVGLTGGIAIAAGYDHSLAVDSNGAVWAWGSNESGKLGIGSTTSYSYPSPVQVSNLSGGVIAVAAGYATSYALKSDGRIWAWGSNGSGRFGNNSTVSSNTPILSGTMTGATIAIAAGGSHLVALSSNGTVWAWGSNSGQVGNGNTATQYIAAKALLPTGLYTSIAAGLYNSAAINSDGALYTWGQNTYGQIGNGTTASTVSTPYAVTSPTGVKAVATGMHTVVSTNSSVFYSWGNNSNGQLGRSIGIGPKPVQFLSDFDHDGLYDYEEIVLGSNPNKSDTNNDGILDGIAVVMGINLTSLDVDGDSISNADEIARGLDPLNPDSDGDGVSDGLDAFPLDLTRSTFLPTTGDVTAPMITIEAPAGVVLLP